MIDAPFHSITIAKISELLCIIGRFHIDDCADASTKSSPVPCSGEGTRQLGKKYGSLH